MTYNWNIAQCSVLLQWWHGEHHEPGVYSTLGHTHTHTQSWYNGSTGTLHFVGHAASCNWQGLKTVCSDIDPDMPAHTQFFSSLSALSHTCLLLVSTDTLGGASTNKVLTFCWLLCWMCLRSSTNDEVTDTNTIKTSAEKLWYGQLIKKQHYFLLRDCSWTFRICFNIFSDVYFNITRIWREMFEFILRFLTLLLQNFVS